MKTPVKKSTLAILTNPRYRGKHLVIIQDEVYTARTGREATRLFDRLTKKFPGKTPTLAYIPKEDTLILWLL